MQWPSSAGVQAEEAAGKEEVDRSQDTGMVEVGDKDQDV